MHIQHSYWEKESSVECVKQSKTWECKWKALFLQWCNGQNPSLLFSLSPKSPLTPTPTFALYFTSSTLFLAVNWCLANSFEWYTDFFNVENGSAHFWFCYLIGIIFRWLQQMLGLIFIPLFFSPFFIVTRMWLIEYSGQPIITEGVPAFLACRCIQQNIH